MNRRYIGKKGGTIKGYGRFTVGDTVRITNLGCAYTGYKDAFNELGIPSLNLKNYKHEEDTPFGIIDTLTSYGYNFEYLKTRNWRVVDACYHEGLEAELYFIVNGESHCGLLIGEDGITLRRKSEENITSHQYLWINH